MNPPTLNIIKRQSDYNSLQKHKITAKLKRIMQIQVITNKTKKFNKLDIS